MSQQQPQLRDQCFVCPVLKVEYPTDWAVLVERAEVSPAYLQVVSIGPREHVVRRAWAMGAPGLGVTTMRTRCATAAAMLEANELHPAGGKEGLVAADFAGYAALWRLGDASPTSWTWVFVVAHGYFHIIKWSSGWNDAQQAIVLGSIRLLNPSESELVVPSPNS